MAERPSLLEQVRRSLRLKHYSGHTERAYVDWIKPLVSERGGRVGLAVALSIGQALRRTAPVRGAPPTASEDMPQSAVKRAALCA